MRPLFFVKLFVALSLAACAERPVAAEAAAEAGDWQSAYAALLEKYAGPTGVAYRKWHADKADLAKLGSVTSAIASANLSGKNAKEQLAFYLNAYNAWILKRILDDYPVAGPGDGGAIKRTYFFKSRSITVAGEKTSFSALENEIIRPKFKEPRIHFALNCASASCPPLHGRPFEASTLDGTLDALTRRFVNGNRQGLQVSGGKARVSRIFEWYAEDFGGAGGVLAFINRYRDEPVPATFAVEFMDYDWSLNEAR